MSTSFLIIMLIGMAVVTIVCRLVPVLLVDRFEPGPKLTLWLEQVPAAVIAAIVVPAMLIHHGVVDVSLDNRALWVGLATIAVAVLTRSFFLTIMAGLGLMIGVSLLF